MLNLLWNLIEIYSTELTPPVPFATVTSHGDSIHSAISDRRVPSRWGRTAGFAP